MYVQRNIRVSSNNDCSSEKAVVITYWQRVCIALFTQHATRMRHIVICGLPYSTMFFHLIS
jgi:hypothetical protein